MQNSVNAGPIVGVVTTINAPNAAMNSLLDYAEKAGSKVVVVGDTKTPQNWEETDFDFLSINTQRRLFPNLCDLIPMKHYARKNLGYLRALKSEPEWLYETDDDNIPLSDPFKFRELHVNASTYKCSTRWLNVYEAFGVTSSSSAPQQLWPRGFDLRSIGSSLEKDSEKTFKSPLQQGLANGDPDVDAIYRLTLGNLITFNDSGPIALEGPQICPVNSQTTWWHNSIFQLMYLPSTCTFRLTDIVRGFVAWRILLESEDAITFHSPQVNQERNEHDLLRDFESEIELFLGSDLIVELLLRLNISSLSIGDALLLCYKSLVEYGVINSDEIQILEAWNRNFM
jgi:hypothetical protein